MFKNLNQTIMKTDKYLKAVLTVIAVCLVVLTLQNMNLIPRAHADDQPVPIPPVANYALVPLNPDGVVEVKIKSIDDILDVNIQKVGGNTCYQGVPVLEKK